MIVVIKDSIENDFILEQIIYEVTGLIYFREVY